MEQAIIVSTLLAPVITGLIQIIKQSNKVNNQYLPLVAIVVGVAFGGIYAYLFNEVLPEHIQTVLSTVPLMRQAFSKFASCASIK